MLPLPPCLVVIGFVSASLAQSPTVTAHELLPLVPGATWTYDVQRTEGLGKPKSTRSVVTVEGACTMPDGTRIHQLRVDTDGARGPRFEPWSCTADGIRRHLTTDPYRRGTLDTAEAPLQWLSLPANTRHWQWQGHHDLAVDEQQRAWTHFAEIVSDAERVTVPAGTWQAVHVRVTSEQQGVRQLTRDLWFAPGVGVVKEIHRDAVRQIERQLVSFTRGHDDREARLHKHLEQELANPKAPAWNNPPFLTWIEDGPEALRLPGRIAVARGEGFTSFYYVDAKAVHRFVPSDAGQSMLAASAAFGAESALVPDDVPLAPLALLVARAEAARHCMARVHEVPVTLTPPRRLPGESHRQVAVQVRGGALDGTERNIAVWLTVRARSELQVATDFEAPKAASRAR